MKIVDGEMTPGEVEALSVALDGMRADDPILQFFAFRHLPDALRKVSVKFALLAANLVAQTPRNPERTVALRKLLEAKDAAVRAAIFK
jgi:hypothetical protein